MSDQVELGNELNPKFIILEKFIMLNLNSDVPIRQVIDCYLNELPQERLGFVAEFLANLINRESDANFFEKTAGCLADDPIERAPQGD